MPNSISVTWNNGPKVDPETLIVNGVGSDAARVVITWVPDATIDITSITKPAGDSGADFDQPTKLGASRNWQCHDARRTLGDASYEIAGTEISSGASAGHDPQIRNQ